MNAPEAIPEHHKKMFEMCWLPALGLNIAFWEFIITTVYQFYFLGFSLSLIMGITSTILLCLKYRDYKIWENG